MASDRPSTAGEFIPAPGDRAFIGHPRGLVVLFFAEMWERFSYYGMRALLVTYLVWHFLQNEKAAYGIYAAYAGMIYLAPLLGGYLADRYLGARKAVLFGGILITFGHFAMAFEGQPAVETLTVGEQVFDLTVIRNTADTGGQFARTIAVDGADRPVTDIALADGQDDPRRTVTFEAADGQSQTLTGLITRTPDAFGQNMMFLALSLIIIGTGFLKANIAAIVGALYPTGDKRRDSGFTLFYFGINVGALLGQLAVAYLGIVYGWAYGFGLAGIGMALGLVIFLIGQSWFEGRVEAPDAVRLRQPVFGPVPLEWAIYLGGFASVGMTYLIVKYLSLYGPADLLALIGITDAGMLGEFTLFEVIISLVFVGALGAIVAFSIRSLSAEERDPMIVVTILTLSSVVFWTLFDQAPTSLILFNSKFVDTGPFEAQQIASFNPFFILLFAPVFAGLWHSMGRHNPSSPIKFALGLAQIGLGYLILNLGIWLDGGDLVISLFWIVILFLLHSTGELCLSPVGLSAVTKLSVPRLIGFMMGVFYMAIAISQVATALVSKATVVAEGTDRALELAQFNTVYFWLGVSAMASAAAMALASPILYRMMHGRE
ncbi:MAG: peptide MFS transporter [Alphaproteobacteria bacterium]